MAEYGGWGGLDERREIDKGNPFEVDLADAFPYVNRELGHELWSALTNIDWRKGEDVAGYSFRAAGDVVAALAGYGNYCDWYCGSVDGVVSERVRRALAERGWTPDV